MLVTAAAILMLARTLGPEAAVGPRRINFDRDIRPVLADACFTCHGPDDQRRKARLRLDTREGLFGPTRDALDGVADATHPARIVTPGDTAASELAFRIASPDPEERMPPPSAARQLTERDQRLLAEWIKQGAPWSGHWAFEPIKAPPLPDVQDAWISSDIDRFILAGLRDHLPGVAPAIEADKRTLLRRASLDLTGLPPTTDELAAFEADADPSAFEHAVDRLLASPRYGEHSAMAWLDVARYADSNGFQLDPDRTAWPWRDWVVQAFNSNMPYDRFVREQIAGDLLPNSTESQRLATAFNRNHPINGEGGREIEESRIDYVHDRVDATATAFLGLTMGCAQCHDHKYDPITQRDYYRFFAFFNSIDEDGAGDRGDMPPLMDISEGPAKSLKVMVMKDRAQKRETHVLIRGAWDHPGDVVEPGTPAALPASTGDTRLALADWLIDPGNPLAARVQVNRIWQQLFGYGLVRAPDNFGIQGERPTHPELLDFLAASYITSGWDTKALIKRIVMSSVYRQASACSSEIQQADPDNRWLARAPRYRLPAHVIRDQTLAASGLLVEKLGGPPVKPYHPAGVWEDVSFGRLKYVAGKGEELYRRSLYTFWRRTAPPANLFDVSLRQKCSVRVIRTITPLQSLTVLNDPTYAEAAAALAEQLLKSREPNDDRRLGLAFERVTCHRVTDRQLAILRSRLQVSREYYMGHPEEATLIANAGDRPDPPADQVVEIAAYATVMTVLFNLDQTLSRE